MGKGVRQLLGEEPLQMKVEIKCIITDGEKVMQEFTVVEFETAKVIAAAGGVDVSQN